MSDSLIFVAMVFVATVLLAQGMIVPAFGESRVVRKRMKERLADIDRASDDAIASILRAKYLQQLSPWEARLETLPYMEGIRTMVEQAGSHVRAYRVVLLALFLMVIFGLVVWLGSRTLLYALVASVAGFALPFFKLNRDRGQRLAKFEEQLPDAIDVMRRALMVGHPFNAALNLVAEDMEDPVAGEFRTTFADMNYGNDVRRAMLGLLQRVPSVTVMALVTSVLVQRETGGNLAEILEQSSRIIRQRFKFQRRVTTLSAEGRMSAWVLAMVPLGLFVVLRLTSPDYFTVMLESSTGRDVIAYTFGWAMIGIFFIRRIIRIDV